MEVPPSRIIAPTLAVSPVPYGTGSARPGTHRRLGTEAPDQERGPGRADGRARGLKKKSWGELTDRWAPHDTRAQVIDFVRRWSERAGISAARFIRGRKMGPG